VDGYRAGETVYELVARFGIHRATVSAHLHRQGITLRRQGLNAEGVAHAVRLYEDGWSVARIGHRLGVDGTTAWKAIMLEVLQLIKMRNGERTERKASSGACQMY
jgi:hypothetical protein